MDLQVSATAKPVMLNQRRPMETPDILAKYDKVVHMGGTIMWCGKSYTSKPGEVHCGTNRNNDLVVHYIKTNTTVTHHLPAAKKNYF